MTTQQHETTLNEPLLRAVQEAITAAPTQFHIAEWCVGDLWPNSQDKCSGSACIAGWAVVLGCRARLSLLEGAEIERLAREALGLRLDEEEGNRLFFLSLWPWEIQEGYISNPKTLADYEANAYLASRRIEVFLQTRE